MTLISRSEWGARPAKDAAYRSFDQITTAHVHYADQAPPAPDNLANAEAMVREIQNFHMDGRGWWDVGYHRLIGPDGTVFEGRPLNVIGAETEGHNTPSVGYCFLTNGPVTDEAWAAFVAQLRVDEDTIGRGLAVRPHSADVATFCPGDPLRARVAELTNPTPPQPAPEPAPAPPPAPAPAPSPQPTTDPLQEVIDMLPTLRNNNGATFDKNTSKAQGLLVAQGTPPGDGRVDGRFGNATETAVRAFQSRQGIADDGIVGPDTWAHLVND